jgi:hypothetical protein
VPELRAANHCHDAELALPRERFRVDDEPRLTLRGEHVAGMKVLMDEDLLALGRRQLA